MKADLRQKAQSVFRSSNARVHQLLAALRAGRAADSDVFRGIERVRPGAR